LFAYDDFIKHYGTPTLIARRDGAIVAVSQEFIILTGWSKDVLLGKKPNRNINTGSTDSAMNSTANSARGTRRPSAEPENSGSGSTSGKAGQSGGNQQTPKNVLIAEIMSQDTVVDFYEDYARLAFGDPMGRALRRGKLLKYRTADDDAVSSLPSNGHERRKSEGGKVKREDNGSGIADEGQFVKLGEKEGQVDCMYMWNVRRDNFEVPQLIVMNVRMVSAPRRCLLTCLVLASH